MKKRISLVFVLVLITCVLVKGQDFRDVSWGDSAKEVKEKETAELFIEAPGVLWYTTTFWDLECGLWYSFDHKDRLFNSSYTFRNEYANPNKYIEDYERLKKLLNEKYGKPTLDKETWIESSPEKDKNKWGKSLKEGKLSLITKWETKETTVDLILDSGYIKGDIFLRLDYNSKELKKEYDEQNKANLLNLL